MQGSERARNAGRTVVGRGAVEAEFSPSKAGAITLPADPDLAVLAAPRRLQRLPDRTLAGRRSARYARAAIRRRTHEHRCADQAG